MTAMLTEERITQGTMRTVKGEVLPLERTAVSAKVNGPAPRTVGSPSLS